jgi:hypothetical protein
VLLAAFAPFALPRVGPMRGVALRMEGNVRARVASGSGVCVEGLMANRAKGGGRGEETYRAGGRGDEAEAVV